MLQVVTDSDMNSEVHNNEKKISYSQSYFYNGHDQVVPVAAAREDDVQAEKAETQSKLSAAESKES